MLDAGRVRCDPPENSAICHPLSDIRHPIRARSSAGQNAPLITVLSQVRVLPGPPPSPAYCGRAPETVRKPPFVGDIARPELAETPDFTLICPLSAKSLWRPNSAPTPSCCREFES